MKNKEVPINEIPEVEQYEHAKNTLLNFRAKNTAIFTMYDSLIEDLEQKRDAADKIVRAKEVSCGDWELYQYSTKYNAVYLYEAVGRDLFLKVGGSLKTVTEYDIDKVKLKAAVASKTIPSQIAKQVTEITPRYHAPTTFKRSL